MNLYFDPATYPLEKVVEKALSREDRDFHTGCQLLIARKEHAEDEVIVVFLGLLAIYSDDLERLTSIVRFLLIVPSEATAQRLFEELRRVKSNNTTRRYLSAVLDALAEYPPTLTEHRFAELSEDPAFSQRRRAQFRALALGLGDPW
jgi:hypothetical protein